jgi:hypothetical protein
MTGSSFVPTSKALAVKHAIINVFNPNDDVFCLGRPFCLTHHAQRVSELSPIFAFNQFVRHQISQPIKPHRSILRGTTQQFPSLCMFGKDEKEVISKYVTRSRKREKPIDLLPLTLSDKNHYVWIKSTGALICHRSTKKNTVYVCPHCVHPSWIILRIVGIIGKKLSF